MVLLSLLQDRAQPRHDRAGGNGASALADLASADRGHLALGDLEPGEIVRTAAARTADLLIDWATLAEVIEIEPAQRAGQRAVVGRLSARNLLPVRDRLAQSLKSNGVGLDGGADRLREPAAFLDCFPHELFFSLMLEGSAFMASKRLGDRTDRVAVRIDHAGNHHGAFAGASLMHCHAGLADAGALYRAVRQRVDNEMLAAAHLRLSMTLMVGASASMLAWPMLGVRIRRSISWLPGERPVARCMIGSCRINAVTFDEPPVIGLISEPTTASFTRTSSM